jgi:capsular exopolysaccharide synthesis family protein
MATVAGVVVLFNLLQTPMYESSIKILVGQERGITQNPSDVAGLQQITRTMSASVSSRPLAEAVIDQMNLSLTPEDFLEERLEVEQVPETQLIQVNYRDSSPERAQQVANTIGDIFSEQVSQVSASASAISATVWEPAVTPDRPASPHPLRNGLIALVLGLIAVLTSPGPGEGKSTTCANLGVVLAQAAKSILVLDCDFRKPVIHKFFGLRNRHGLVDVLVGEYSLQEVWHEPMEGLKVVSVGAIPLNPAEILGSRRFSKLLAGVREEFDYVLIDASPIGPVSDPAILATQGDGVLLILDAQNTRKVAVRQAIRSLEAVGARVLGTVMNNAKITKSDYYYYGAYTYE